MCYETLTIININSQDYIAMNHVKATNLVIFCPEENLRLNDEEPSKYNFLQHERGMFFNC